MDISSMLIAIIIYLGAATTCVLVFERLGFGVILGCIAAGIIIGPNTPGPILSSSVSELQNIAELGVMLFLFTVGLELRPQKVWALRRLIFGLGSAQMILTAIIMTGYLIIFFHTPWESAVIVGLGLSMSSTAIVMGTLGEKGELPTEHGQTAFAVLMAQDLWVVPVMALVPILAHSTGEADAIPLWQTICKVAGVIAVILLSGHYLLPRVLGYCAKHRQINAFAMVLFLAVIIAAWMVDYAGISITLGAFLLGMLLSASDFRYQIEATVAPFKETLMSLFFVTVGMSIDVNSLINNWSTLLVHVPIIVGFKCMVISVIALAFGIKRAPAIRTGFYLSQVGEFSFVLFAAAAGTELLSSEGHTLAMLVIAVSMILTPIMVKTGNKIADLFLAKLQTLVEGPAEGLERHVVVIGFDEVSQLIAKMLEKANIPYVVFDKDFAVVQQGKASGYNVHFGDMNSFETQSVAGFSKANAAFVNASSRSKTKALAISLHRLYPELSIYARVQTLADQSYLVNNGITHARTSYIESTMVVGGILLKNLGVKEESVNELVTFFRNNDYELVGDGSVSSDNN
ncbi:cation:proton antiporter domain-containing protein [Desulfogranum marinum]|uniref:cation:proton antiporter domain-containing protein n=1 Tax=Desulfogranum marinum TaxID=453220 RepID=UPI001963F889|nr:cation:proton antiporter [Desulfogranum marinum]MBM9512453.1 cation:proton antiporter [Desulfogranum marinum]